MQDAESATLTLKRTAAEDATSSETRTIRAKFVVGADGANSMVRQSLGIENEDKGYFFDWLILDMLPKFDYVASRKGEPAQWQLCDPKRPTTIVPGGPGPVPGGRRAAAGVYGAADENAEEMQKPENAWKLLAPWGVTPENAVFERTQFTVFRRGGRQTGTRGAVRLRVMPRI